MSTVRQCDVSVPESPVTGAPGEIDVSFEQHPSGALRASFNCRGQWEVEVRPGWQLFVTDAVRNGDPVHSPPAWVKEIVRNAVERLR